MKRSIPFPVRRLVWSTALGALLAASAIFLADDYRVAEIAGGGEVGDSIAEDVAARAARVPILAWVWSGGQSAVGAMVKARLTAATTDVRLRISRDSTFATYTQSGPTSTAGNNVVTFMLSGLAADTRYYYRVIVGKVEDTIQQGAFRTLPPPRRAHSFVFAVGSCQRTGSNNPVFGHIRATDPLFWLQVGDIHYSNLDTNDVGLFRLAYDQLHAQPNQAALYRSTPIVYVWDDHDGGGGNDGDKSDAGWPAARAAYRENVPHHPLPAGPNGAIYHSFVVGRVRFIVSDLRSERSPSSRPDNPNKTMFGDTQKRQFKAELAAARANQQFVVWVSASPWIAERTDEEDDWGGYDTERQEIAAYIQSLGIAEQMFVITGDMHATAIDTGKNNAWGGFPLFNPGPIDQDWRIKGGPYSHGPFTNGSEGEQFGLVAVRDTGGPSIEVTFSGRRNGEEISGAYHRFTLTLD